MLKPLMHQDTAFNTMTTNSIKCLSLTTYRDFQRSPARYIYAACSTREQRLCIVLPPNDQLILLVGVGGVVNE